jgi:hypothetical protein
MLAVKVFGERKGKGFGSGGKTPTGSRRFVELDDGSIVKWWGGKWHRKWQRFDTAVATSLNTRAMAVAVENGRWREEREEFTDAIKFFQRLKDLVGAYEALRIVEWISRRKM